jgi:hypothetical protein
LKMDPHKKYILADIETIRDAVNLEL